MCVCVLIFVLSSDVPSHLIPEAFKGKSLSAHSGAWDVISRWFYLCESVLRTTSGCFILKCNVISFVSQFLSGVFLSAV